MMCVVLRTGGLFREGDLRDFLNDRKQKLFEEIDSLGEDPLLTASSDELCDQYVRKGTISIPEIDQAGIHSEFRDSKIDIVPRFRPEIAGDHDPLYSPGTRVTFYVPVGGDLELLECRPTHFEFEPPNASVGDGELSFKYERSEVEAVWADKDDWPRKPFERDLKSLEKYLGWIADDLAEFNSLIQETVRQRIHSRRERLHDIRRRAEQLGFPTAMEPNSLTGPPASVLEFREAGSRTVVTRGDDEFCLPPKPAKAVRFMYDEYIRTGRLDVDERRVLHAMGTKQSRVDEAVRHTEIWGKLIGRGSVLGTVALIL